MAAMAHLGRQGPTQGIGGVAFAKGLRAVLGLHCGGGVGATLHAFTLNRLGIEALVYDGSLFEWTKDDNRPVETG
jgi:3-mercaptopyruvate sulfurtransferase SseA